MAYQECMAKYGSDKPDLRITNEIQDLQDNIKMMAFKNDEIQKMPRPRLENWSRNTQVRAKIVNWYCAPKTSTAIFRQVLNTFSRRKR